MGTLTAGAGCARPNRYTAGRTTQVWDAKVSDEASGKLLAAFRCTQIILYPRA